MTNKNVNFKQQRFSLPPILKSPLNIEKPESPSPKNKG